MSVGIPIRCVAAAVCILWAAYLAGCVKVIPRQPNTKAVEELGADAAKQRLQEVMTRAIEPPIVIVTAMDDEVRYKWDQQIHRGWYAVPDGTIQHEAQIYFRNIEKMEVYENNKVFVYLPGGRAEILFPNQTDAFQFHDLIESFRMRSATAPAAAPAPTPANPPANP